VGKPKRTPPCSNKGHNLGEGPCPNCTCGWTTPCLLPGCPHCDSATTTTGKRLTNAARALKLAEATMQRQEKRAALVLGRLLKTRAEVVRLRGRLERLEAEATKE
jgi:hypothetical protein